MSDSKVIGLVTQEQKNAQEYQKGLLEIVDHFRKMVKDGEVSEFVIASLDTENEVVITSCAKDFLGAVGLFEMGKQTLISQQTMDFDFE
jgi:hypothetical protein